MPVVLPGPPLTFAELQQCLVELRRLATSAKFVVASGSLAPAGISRAAHSGYFQRWPRTPHLRRVPPEGQRARTTRMRWGATRHGVRADGRRSRDHRQSSRLCRRRIDGIGGALVATSTESKCFPAMPLRGVSGVGAGGCGAVCNCGRFDERLAAERVGTFRYRRWCGDDAYARNGPVHPSRHRKARTTPERSSALTTRSSTSAGHERGYAWRATITGVRAA